MKWKEQKKNLTISRKPPTASKLEVSGKVTREIENVCSNGGSPLDSKTKEIMESKFGYEFNKVRICRLILIH